ncbi:hypothetical protein F511_09179 [Dorcoceras hygrometricum]|uniref:Transmembrane protein n=1 Tax=Dorcoceras hygrometricum TaxID=472368 RepID=A0A2Z7D067_9LAMI|nr:hypothetical protein F511_09179 [Dorcoceras hygrometricum]
MYRSASTNRVLDGHFSHHSSSAALRALSLEASELPVYEPMSETAKKDRARARFSEDAVHFIPLVLLLCALILWVFSSPDIGARGSSIAAKIQGMTIEGDVDTDGTGHLPAELGDLDLTKPADNNINIENIAKTRNPRKK